MFPTKLIAVAIDDENNALESLSNMLSSFFSDSIELIATENRFDEGLALVERIRPEVLFLDVDLDRTRSGFDFSKALREKNIHSKIIFITAYEQFGIKALREDAFDYLVKPIDRDDLASAINRLQNRLPLKVNDFILINNKEALHKVQLNSILFIRAEGSYSEIHIENKTRPLLTSYNLSMIEMEISSISDKFYRIHKSYLINKEKIVTIKKQLTSKKVVLSDNTEIPISRNKYSEFLAIFMNS